MPPPEPTHAERRKILDNVLRVIGEKYMGPPPDISKLRADHTAAIIEATSVEAFDAAMTAMLRDLGASHTGFFHESAPRTAGRIAIAATFTKAITRDGERWVFLDVHPGGAAHAAGVRRGDVLLSVNGRDLAPPESTSFVLGQQYEIVLRKKDGSTTTATLSVPRPKDKRQPVVVPSQVVTTERLDGRVGVLRVSMFPGMLGMDVARDMSRAVADLAADRLIVDLRGNTGGGMGCLRLMSLLCADRRAVGYSVGREAIKAGRTKDQLPIFDRIPSSKLGVLPLFVKFARSASSVALFTEALGARRYHGRVVILVNEHSASAAEMVAAFAKEYGLATVVGTKTAGRVVAASSLEVGSGYRVALPVAEYFTWQDCSLEGRGVEPDVVVPVQTVALLDGRDEAIERAAEVVKQNR